MKIRTWSGRMVDPLRLRPRDVEVIDIATALANTCRFKGQCRAFYSVAEHSVRVSEMVPAPFKLAALVHDAQEAYLCDVPSPTKIELDWWQAVEDRAWRAIAARFGLQFELPPCVHRADKDACQVERAMLWGPCPSGLLPAEAKALWLEAFRRCT